MTPVNHKAEGKSVDNTEEFSSCFAAISLLPIT